MIATQEPSTVAVFHDLETANQTLENLRRAGFHEDELGVIGNVDDRTVPTPPELHAPEENASNAFIKGNILGATVGALVIAIIPGLGEVAGLGRWFEIVGGAILGAMICGLMVAFGSFIFSGPETRRYAAELDKGRFIVVVKNPERHAEAMSILANQGTLVEQAPR